MGVWGGAGMNHPSPSSLESVWNQSCPQLQLIKCPPTLSPHLRPETSVSLLSSTRRGWNMEVVEGGVGLMPCCKHRSVLVIGFGLWREPSRPPLNYFLKSSEEEFHRCGPAGGGNFQLRPRWWEVEGYKVSVVVGGGRGCCWNPD